MTYDNEFILEKQAKGIKGQIKFIDNAISPIPKKHTLSHRIRSETWSFHLPVPRKSDHQKVNIHADSIFILPNHFHLVFSVAPHIQIS